MTPRQAYCRDAAALGRWGRATCLRLGIPFSDVITMTPAQMHHLCLYPVDSHGAPRQPDLSASREADRPPATLAEELRRLAGFKPFMSDEKYQAARARLEQIYAEEANGDGD